VNGIIKICSKCKIEKPIEEFHKGNGKDGYHTWCKLCIAAYFASPKGRASKSKTRRTLNARYNWLRSLAKGRKIEFKITLEELATLSSQPCYY
jgi:hypothetical protein